MDSELFNLCIKKDIEKLDGFFAANPKDVPSPIPTILSPEAVLIYIKPKLAMYPSGLELEKISQLTIFYNMNKLEENFLERLRKNKELTRDKQVSAVCIIALAWISRDPQQIRQLPNEYEVLLQKLSFPDDIELAVRVCDALSSQQALGLLKSSMQAQSSALGRQIQNTEIQSNEGRREMLQGQQKKILNFLKNEIPQLEQNIAERNKILTTNTKEQVEPMVKLYMGDIKDQRDWIGIKLVRLAQSDEQIRKLIAPQFLTQAKTYPVNQQRIEELEVKYKDNRKGSLVDREYVTLHSASVRKERCLYAAEFFGVTLDKEQAEWLKKQTDNGMNLLALRPDWKYPER